MPKIKTEHYEISYDKRLKSYVKSAIEIAEEGRAALNQLFDYDDECMVLKASYFCNRVDFVNYIKSISGGHEPPIWATGCFYNNEIQILVDVENEKDMNFKDPTLLHETVHLYFDNCIYNKYNIPRIRWLDESFACYLDGTTNKIKLQDLKNICLNIKDKNFDANILNDVKKVKTKNYNGYDMFKVIGFYIFNRHVEKEMLDTLKTNFKKTRLIGKSILKSAIDFVLDL